MVYMLRHVMQRTYSHFAVTAMMGGDHFYDKNQTSVWRVMCIMLRGSMKSHNGDFIVSLRIFHCTFLKNTWHFQ